MHRRNLSKAIFACATGVVLPPQHARGSARTAPHHPRTEAEVAASITPTDFIHVPGSVLRYGADPTGAADSAPAFLQAQTVATRAGVELLIPGGSYKANSALVWGYPSLCVRASGKVTITFTNPGRCITVDGGAEGPGVYGVQVSGYIRVVGNKATTDAWFVRACHHSSLQMRAGDCTTALRTNWCVLTKFELTCSSGEAPFTALTPTSGIVADQRERGATTAGCTFNIPTLEGIAGIGIDLQGTLQCVFVGGSSEWNQTGVRQANANNIGNTFVGMDFESNTTQDILVTGGSSLTFVNINSMSLTKSPTTELASGDATTFIGGYLRWLNVRAAATGTALFATQTADGWGIGIQGPGAVATFAVQKVDGNRAVTGKVERGRSDFSAHAQTIASAITASAGLVPRR